MLGLHLLSSHVCLYMSWRCRYEDGYDGSEPVVKWFWEALLSLDDEEKKLFLKFVSGRSVGHKSVVNV
jgi:hypothetical protein